MRYLLLGALVSFFLSSCSGVGSVNLEPKVMTGIVERISDPIFQITVEDAQSTIDWIQKNPDLTEEQKVDAMRCPTAVLSLEQVRQNLLNIGEKGEGRRALIYYATVQKYTQDPREQAKAAAQNVVEACAPLVINNSGTALQFLAPGA